VPFETESGTSSGVGREYDTSSVCCDDRAVAGSIERACIVLDCCNVRQMDRPFLNLLLGCLEEAMKRNGDVKLAAVSSHAKLALKQNGAHRLFEVFDTNTEAVRSFQRRASVAISGTFVPANSSRALADTA